MMNELSVQWKELKQENQSRTKKEEGKKRTTGERDDWWQGLDSNTLSVIGPWLFYG